MSGDLARAKQTVLALLGGRWPDGGVPERSLSLVAEMARHHRLGAMLAWQAERKGWTLPKPLNAEWQAVRRGAGMAALAQQAALRLAMQALDQAGIACVALKGVALAWRSYPEAGLRPMRDIDLLVPQHRILEAARVLECAGFRPDANDAATLDVALAVDHQLPAQHHAGLGVTVELHHRLTDPPGRHGYRIPQLKAEEVWERAQALDCGGVIVPCPAPEDLAAHLIVHATYGHRLDCGPLVLADLHFMIEAGTCDWDAVRAAAGKDGWSPAMDLLSALTDRWFGTAMPCSNGVTPSVLDQAETALLADPAARGAMAAAAEFSGFGGQVPYASIVRRLRPDPEIVAREGRGLPKWAFWPLWAIRRGVRALARAANPRLRDEARAAREVTNWLEG